MDHVISVKVDKVVMRSCKSLLFLLISASVNHPSVVSGIASLSIITLY